MGIYDREYYREESRGFSLGGDRLMVTNLVLVTVAIYVAQLAFGKPLTGVLEVEASSLSKPWLWWKFLSYGFAHSTSDVLHVGFNMFILWMFGRDVESVYGRREVLRLYLTMIVFSGAVWAAFEMARGNPMVPCVGASGAVTGFLILFALNFPRRIILLFFVLPVPAWVVAVLIVVLNLTPFLQQQEEPIAYAAHLAGAGFAFLYFRGRWNLGRLVPASLGWDRVSSMFRTRPKLRLHDPEQREQRLNTEVDRILEKIHQEGESSLTEKERRTLKDASRRYQQKRR